MRKWILAAVTLLLSIGMLAGCGAAKENPSGTASTGENKYYFQSQGVKFAMNDKAADILKVLGETETKKIPSCAHQGEDTVYYYDNYGYELETYTIDGVEYISCVWISSDAAATPEGLSIGDSEEKIETLYGEKQGDAKAYIYEDQNTTLTIMATDGAVSSIQYSAVVE
ncbi:MAG: hypothetical protein IJW78_03820 [Clostridia bacterium]|nr:hypothetical protein [Clostridia bacterium]